MIRPSAILFFVLTGFLAGCGSSLRSSGVTPPGWIDAAPEDSRAADGGAASSIDSLPGASDPYLDEVVVPIDTLASAPDISDSLAAATQARLPSVDELFDYPVEVNRRVLAWIDFYLGRGKANFERSLRRSGRFLAMARRIFAQEGIPQDLAFLAHVESGFRHNARSPAHALGLWQFMRATARLYGLRCDAYVDERLDPERSTRAAARHLRDLYARYNDWYLALAAYNAGAGKVDRAIRRTGWRDFWHISGTGYLRNETRNFVPAILAATILAKSPAAYGLTEETQPPLEYDTVAVDSPTDLRIVAHCAQASPQEIRDLNPAVLQMQTPPRTGSFNVRVPRGSGPLVSSRIQRIPPEKRLIVHRYTVRRGDTLGKLARRYGTTVRAIQDANAMGRRTTIYAGRTLKIPAGGSLDFDLEAVVPGAQQAASRVSGGSTGFGGSLARPRADGAAPRGEDSRRLRVVNTSDALGRVPSTAHIVASARESAASDPPEASPGARTHVVRRGETLAGIAARHGISLREICRWNGLTRRSIIRPGQTLHVNDPGAARSSGDRVHVVRRGESLWSIARRYGVRLTDLIDGNHIPRSLTIYPGQRLRLP